jgi:hypothetical protein
MSFLVTITYVSTAPEGRLVVLFQAREYLILQLVSDDLYDEKWLGAFIAFSPISNAQSLILLVNAAPVTTFLKLVRFLKQGAACMKILNVNSALWVDGSSSLVILTSQ